MISLGLEWLYRVIKEPFRIRRLLVIPRFLLLVISENLAKRVRMILFKEEEK